MPFGWISAIATVASSLIGANASKSAANTQANAANNATAVQQQMFQQTRSDLAPYMGQGQIGLNDLNKLLADPTFLTKLPGYQFQLQQGENAITNAGAASGVTGNTLKALSDYGQGTASSYYNNFWNQAMQMANLGQTSAAGVGNIGASVGNSIGNNMIGAGNAIAAGQVGSANALAGGINNGISNYLLYSMMNGGGGAGGGGNVPGYSGVGTPFAPTDYSLSDRRLKTDLRQVGTSPRGYRLYEWRWRATGELGFGVVAQEVAAVDPSAVRMSVHGFLMVDYSKV